ncbi:MAG: type II secretion system F family protein [Candidatus Syntrophonatronum acetioxidans]|uniref:Type II secretion system F family protein n=1 Tax=Candidatus Syntrophonatronum acetioxidans TaxID=1795816 RepID=A0A424YD28_9FIRM|nr:MAG: type II secretion system F family protein [Candidatus Syntrophonatronum acetioxidans]
MPQYKYEVINNMGEEVSGMLEADHEGAVIDRLQKRGLMITGIKEVPSSPLMEMLKKRRKVKLGDLSLFSRQLAAMLDAGIPVTRALFTLSEQADNPILQEALGQIANSVEGGSSLTDAISSYPDIFSDLYIGMIRAGELGGTLEDTLLRLSEQLQKDKNLQDSVKSATFYPTVVGVFAVIVLLAMMFFIVPIFMGFFPPDIELPFLTRLIIGMSESLRSYWYLWFLVVGGILLGIRYYLNTTKGIRAWDRVRFRLPVFGTLIHRVVIARFARTLSTLLAGGISVVQALETAGPTSGSYLMEQAVSRANTRIQEGRSLVEPLRESGIFPPMVTHMIGVGEETGALPNLLTRIAEFYEDEVATMTKGLTSLIEPLMLIVVGVLVGGMLVALYMPIFTVITQV